MAIEVEKKFLLDSAEKTLLIEGAEFIATKTFTDVYYDNANVDLATKNIWLRARDGVWELKIPLGASREHGADAYREIVTEKDIVAFITLPADIPLADALQNAGYEPFATITTTRTKYKKDGFNIDLDAADFGFEIAEIEKMVSEESDMTGATEEISAFAGRHHLRVGRVRGKLVEYLFRKNKPHFDALVAAGVVSPDGKR